MLDANYLQLRELIMERKKLIIPILIFLAILLAKSIYGRAPSTGYAGSGSTFVTSIELPLLSCDGVAPISIDFNLVALERRHLAVQAVFDDYRSHLKDGAYRFCFSGDMVSVAGGIIFNHRLDKPVLISGLKLNNTIDSVLFTVDTDAPVTLRDILFSGAKLGADDIRPGTEVGVRGVERGKRVAAGTGVGLLLRGQYHKVLSSTFTYFDRSIVIENGDHVHIGPASLDEGLMNSFANANVAIDVESGRGSFFLYNIYAMDTIRTPIHINPALDVFTPKMLESDSSGENFFMCLRNPETRAIWRGVYLIDGDDERAISGRAVIYETNVGRLNTWRPVADCSAQDSTCPITSLRSYSPFPSDGCGFDIDVAALFQAPNSTTPFSRTGRLNGRVQDRIPIVNLGSAPIEIVSTPDAAAVSGDTSSDKPEVEVVGDSGNALDAGPKGCGGSIIPPRTGDNLDHILIPILALFAPLPALCFVRTRRVR